MTIINPQNKNTFRINRYGSDGDEEFQCRKANVNGINDIVPELDFWENGFIYQRDIDDKAFGPLPPEPPETR